MLLIKRYKYLFLLFAVLTIQSGKAETIDQHLNIALRNIGHEFLMKLNDSTSRVLPLKRIDGRYAIQFEREFSFEPDFLLFATNKVIEEFNIRNSFIVEVEKCDTKELVYSFEAKLNKSNKQIACKLRELPKNCYVFYFTKIGTTQIVESAPSSGFSFWAVFALVLIIGLGIFYLVKKIRSTKLNSNLINIGQFQFDQKGMMLLLKAQSIVLSSKESDLLYLLFSNENKTLEREYILKVVWGDEGDYVGRTLDVFISKLRKKLEGDSSLKIINVRGIGYRFVIN